MLKHKNPRKRGKISFSAYFKELKEGDTIAVVKEHSVPFKYSSRMQGRTGKVIAKRGEAYEVEVKDLGRPKRYMIHPVHLHKVSQ
ncbi:50S ribosomal protein L21e [Candidatus Pacearchaeota archaeon]|nr:50S ribosomal protein L21e [Candidatus Pacearchaeota archaeon]